VKKIKEIQVQNEKWQKELDNPPDLEDVEAINAEIVRTPPESARQSVTNCHFQRTVNREHGQTRTRMEELQDRQKANVDSSAAQKAEINGALGQ